jgi:hypothetical protein
MSSELALETVFSPGGLNPVGQPGPNILQVPRIVASVVLTRARVVDSLDYIRCSLPILYNILKQTDKGGAKRKYFHSRQEVSIRLFSGPQFPGNFGIGPQCSYNQFEPGATIF